MLYPYIYYHFNCKNTTNFDYITYKLINLIFTQQSKKITYVSLIKKNKKKILVIIIQSFLTRQDSPKRYHLPY